MLKPHSLVIDRFDEIIPLKLLFQEDPLSNIQATPETIR